MGHSVTSAQSKTSSTCSYTTPLTSPTGERGGERGGEETVVGVGTTQVGRAGGSVGGNDESVIGYRVREVFQPGDGMILQSGSQTTQIRNKTLAAGTECVHGTDRGQAAGMECVHGTDRGHEAGKERESGTDLVKFSLEVDAVSVQFDVQEKCTDLVLKVSAIEAGLHRRDVQPSRGGPWCQQAREGGRWDRFLSSEKILSSKGSTLPQDLCDILTHSAGVCVWVWVCVYASERVSEWVNECLCI